ncbi:MAG TPA: lysis system i-spanin subunit Rz [Methylotenera sp.]|nr:lysis system i-spanin subunit Rz [Methylotenera sp.]
MINPWTILFIAGGWLLSLFSVGYWMHGVGRDGERVAWQQRENKELVDANTLIISLQTAARNDEHANALALNKISTSYQKELQNADIEKDKFIADVRAGRIVLRQPITRSEKSSGGITAEALAAASGHNGETDAELSRETSEFLYSEATRANKVVEQLTACQAVVIEDRKLCGVNEN